MTTLRFAAQELHRRELPRDGAVVHLEPKVLERLAFPINRREPALAKRELMDAHWPDAVATERSLQRTVSLARSALGDAHGDVIRTLPRFGYRFVASVACSERRGLQRALGSRRRRARRVAVARACCSSRGSRRRCASITWSTRSA